MDSFVASGAPAGTAGRITSMTRVATHLQLPPYQLLLKVALEAEIMIPLGEHALIYRAVRRVAGGTTLAQGLVLEDEGSLLRRVALKAGLIFSLE